MSAAGSTSAPGAQGGEVADLGAAFKPHPAAALVTSSRSIVNAHEKLGGDPAKAAAAAAEELRKTASHRAISLYRLREVWGRKLYERFT